LDAQRGMPVGELCVQDVAALERGAETLAAHIDIVKAFGMRAVVGVNRFPTDTERELDLLTQIAKEYGADAAVVNDGFGHGGEGAGELAEAGLGAANNGSAADPR